jgi:feruloyl-CoA synthase
VDREDRPDGSVVLRSRIRLAEYPRTMSEVFRRGRVAHPDRVLVADRSAPDGGWRRLTWEQAGAQADAVAAWLVGAGLVGRPVMVLSGNSVEHLVITLACFRIGSPVVPVSVAYSLQSEDHDKLRRMVGLARPALVYAEDSTTFDRALAAVHSVVGEELVRVVSRDGGAGTIRYADLVDAGARLPLDLTDDLTDGPDDVAKLLFTSGSTGEPKAVVTTHRMLCANQQAMHQVWPFLVEEPPVLLDWLPWSHTFGGNHNVGMVLFNGGSLYVDDGRPAPALLDRTLANLAEVRPTVFFNVPIGYALLVPRLAADPQLARRFFARMRVVFFAAAALPQQVWDTLRELAAVHAEHPVAVTTSWGATETAPAATSAHFASDRSDCIGVPLPGVELKLARVGDKQEIRVRGPHVTPGYHARPDLTAAAFDEEGFYRTGDAVELIDATDPARGIRFAGRIAEDFKLDTGTWVNVAAVKAGLLSACGGVLQDCVVAGHDRAYVSAMAWLNPVAAAHLVESYRPEHGARPLIDAPAVRAHLAESLATMNEGEGSSRRVVRLLLLEEPPRLDAGEITDKGYVNQRATLTRRADQVGALYRPGPHPDIVEVARHALTGPAAVGPTASRSRDPARLGSATKPRRTTLTTDDHAPYADPEPLAEQVEECRCLEAECTAHGVDLHQQPRPGFHLPAEPVVISEKVGHLVDGMTDYGC